MNKGVVVTGALVAVGLIAGVTYLNNSNKAAQEQRQKDLESKLQSMQDQLNRQQLAGAPQSQSVAPPTPANAGGATSRSFLAQENDANQTLATGERLLSTGDPEKAQTAAKIFQEAIDKIDPKNADFYAGLGRANLLMKHYAEATQAFKKGLELKPKRVDLWVGMGSAYWGVKDYYHAKVVFEQAIALDPKCMEAWSVMAWVYLGLQDKENSMKGFQVLVDSGADRMEWKTGLTMARAGNITVDQVRRYFPLPDPKLFLPPATATTTPAATRVN